LDSVDKAILSISTELHRANDLTVYIETTKRLERLCELSVGNVDIHVNSLLTVEEFHKRALFVHLEAGFVL
jgi:hypothetical protein